jgi:hypothetical protein
MLIGHLHGDMCMHGAWPRLPRDCSIHFCDGDPLSAAGRTLQRRRRPATVAPTSLRASL